MEALPLGGKVGLIPACPEEFSLLMIVMIKTCEHSTHYHVTLPGWYLTLRVRSVFGIENSPDVIYYVTASTECHTPCDGR